MGDVGLWLLILFGAYGVGAVLVERGHFGFGWWPKKCVFATALGLGLLAYLVLALGLWGGLRPGWGWLLVGAFLLTAVGQTLREVHRWRRQAAKAAATPVAWETKVDFFSPLPSPAPHRVRTVLLAALLVGVLGLGFIRALAPATAWDDLTYHLAAPKVFVQHARIIYLPYDHHSNFPFTLEMLYTLGLLLRGQTVAKLFHFACFLLTILALIAFGRDYLGPRAGGSSCPPPKQVRGEGIGLTAATIFALAPTVMWETGTAYNEFGLALFQLLAVYSFLEYLNLRSTTLVCERTPQMTCRERSLHRSPCGAVRRPRPTNIVSRRIEDQGRAAPPSASSGRALSRPVQPVDRPGDKGVSPAQEGFPISVAPIPQAALRQPAWITLIGVFCGLALGVKATGGLVLILLLGGVAVLGWIDRLSFQATSGAMVKLSLIAVLIGSPWYIKSYIWTGNPVFPFAHGVFRSPWWSADRDTAYREAQQDFGRPEAVRRRGDRAAPDWNAHLRLSRFPTVLWRLTMRAPDFYDQRTFFALGHIGPLFLAFLPVAGGLWIAGVRHRARVGLVPYAESRAEEMEPVVTREFGAVDVPRCLEITEQLTIDVPRVVGFLLAYSLLSLLFWFKTMQYTRYLIPLLPLWSLLAAYGVDGAARLTAYLRPVVWGVTFSTLALNWLVGLLLAWPDLGVALGHESREAYLSRHWPDYEAFDFLNQTTPPSAKIALFGEPLGFYCDRPYLYAERGHSTLIPYEQFHSADDLLRYWQEELHVTHLLVNELTFPWRDAPGPEPALLREAWQQGRLKEVYRAGKIVVWEVRFR